MDYIDGIYMMESDIYIDRYNDDDKDISHSTFFKPYEEMIFIWYVLILEIYDSHVQLIFCS